MRLRIEKNRKAVLYATATLNIPTFENKIITKKKPKNKSVKKCDEHSEQARAPHTNGPRDVPRCGPLSLL
jgi:hypothetical protein